MFLRRRRGRVESRQEADHGDEAPPPPAAAPNRGAQLPAPLRPHRTAWAGSAASRTTEISDTDGGVVETAVLVAEAVPVAELLRGPVA